MVLGRRGVSLVISALLVLATGVATVALAPTPANAATTPLALDLPSGLPTVTVEATSAPMNNTTSHTGVTQTASCPTGTTMVGGGGYVRNAANPATVPTNGLVLGGTNPSTGASPVDQPAPNGTTNPSHWMSIGNFTGQADPAGTDQDEAFALCATNGPTNTVVVSTTTTGANATQQVNPPTLTIATCPANTTLIGGGALTNTPDQVNNGTTTGNNGNLKPMGSYPSDASGVPAADGSTSATSWSAYGAAGVPASTDTVTSLALCTSDAIGPVQVARQDASFTTGTLTVTPVCPPTTQLIGGGFSVDETVGTTPGLQPQQGYHMRGSYPSTTTGTPPPEATTSPTAWTALVQAGGAGANGPVSLHGFAMCAQPTSMTTPTPTPVVTPTPSPTPVVTPTPSPTPVVTPTPSPTPVVTPTPSPTPVVTPTPTPTPAPGAIKTTTKLSVITIPLPLGLGGFVLPIATVTPSNAAGTVQFKNGMTNFGAPVSVTGGVAVGPLTSLPRGTYSITAVFTPTNPAKFAPSTSNTVTVPF
jgi:Bacterial Ig-like domain (group 3)